MYCVWYTSLLVLHMVYISSCIPNGIPLFLYCKWYTSLLVLQMVYLSSCIANGISLFLYCKWYISLLVLHMVYLSSCIANGIPPVLFRYDVEFKKAYYDKMRLKVGLFSFILSSSSTTVWNLNFLT